MRHRKMWLFAVWKLYIINQYLLAFHEAIGDAIALSVATPKHLQTLGLIQKSVDDTAHDVNFLFALALDKVRYKSLYPTVYLVRFVNDIWLLSWNCMMPELYVTRNQSHSDHCTQYILYLWINRFSLSQPKVNRDRWWKLLRHPPIPCS